jgi:hypothetical protein
MSRMNSHDEKKSMLNANPAIDSARDRATGPGDLLAGRPGHAGRMH